MPSGEAVRRLAGDAAAARQPGAIVLVNANGLVKDFDPPGFDPDVATELWIDPTPQPRVAGKEYALYNFVPASGGANNIGAFVTKATADGVYFKAYQAAKITLGPTEPVWANNVVHGTAKWTEVAYGAWAALHGYIEGDLIVANGKVWRGDGIVTSGALEPDWTTAPGYYSTVADGSGVWTNLGAVTAWAANAVHSFAGNLAVGDPGNIYILPTTPAGFLYQASYGLGAFAVSGASDPAWDAVISGAGSMWSDGEILWIETTSLGDNQCVVTGLAAPSGPRRLTIRHALAIDDSDWAGTLVGTLDAAVVVAGGWNNEAESEAANRIFQGEASTETAPSLGQYTLSAGQALDLIYSSVRARWELALAPVITT
jgi:hypothetical protein